MTIDRRTLMKTGAGLLLFAGLPAHAAAAVLDRPLGANPFTLGVASGDPWPDGFVIWTRLAPRPLDEHGGMPQVTVPVTWEVAEDERFARVVRKGEAMARPELGHSVHVEVGGLSPHRHYWYRFAVAGSDASPVGRARTAPAADAGLDRLRIGVAGCQHWEAGLYGAWGALAREPDVDLLFHYGDYIYEGAGRPVAEHVVRSHAGDEIYSLDDYRRRYAQYKADPQLQAAHQSCAFASSFDDHEVDNNWAGDFDQDGTPPEAFLLRRMAGYQAWYENMPVRRAQMPGLEGIRAFRRLDFGRLLRMHVLDTRSYRTDQSCNDIARADTCTPEAHASPEMLGHVQEAWLDEGLGNQRTWNLLAQQVIVMPLDVRAPGQDRPILETDLWDGYRPAKARLVESIRRNGLSNVVIATGDHHKHAAGIVPENGLTPDGKPVAVEFLATSISSGGNGRGEEPFAHVLRNNPNLDLYTDRRGYQLFDITPQRWTTEVKVIDEIEKPGGAIRTLVGYQVTPDRPALHRL
ncbi:alkaline phosphatase D [Sphingomonas zeicaulis]|uniref:alkaline phosphatase D family protein n=1 Tax=Sphingomonas zeicaulis TaxID=1632740 RepID=UPI003D2020BC